MLAFLSGAFLPIQAGLNAKLGKAAESPVHASMISFVVGALILIIYLFVTRQQFSWAGLKAAPYYVWIGGALGAFYVTVIILAFPKLGPGYTFGLVVAGQMIFSLVLDHFNILVTQPHPISWGRVAGVLLIVSGVIILKKF